MARLCTGCRFTPFFLAVLMIVMNATACGIDSILEDRIDNLLPQLMKRTGIDMWILISREYNEDPVMKTMLPSAWLSARRRTIMVFYKPENGDPLEKIAIARYSVGRLLKGEWNIDVYPDQWEALVLLDITQSNK